jgi:putative hydrolase of the HAD superfamily
MSGAKSWTPMMMADRRREPCPLAEVETWIFDLDNTLYPASCRLFDQIHANMTRFIAERLELTADEALLVQKRYFREHGTTMRGLMTVNGVDPREFMDYVHRIDLACVPANPALVAALAALPGRKLVHTNGSVKHAENLLAHLGITQAFEGVVDIEAAGWEPKPGLAGYHELIRRHRVDPRRALMVEDIARNLAPAAALGMTTAWVCTTIDWAAAESQGDHIHHVVDDLGAFLSEAAALSGQPSAARRRAAR